MGLLLKIAGFVGLPVDPTKIKLILGAIVLFAVGLTIFLGYRYIEAKDAEIARQAQAIGNLQGEIRIKDAQIQTLQTTTNNLTRDLQVNNQLIGQMNARESELQQRLGTLEADIRRRNLDALREGSHRELVLDVLNRQLNGMFNVGRPVQRPTPNPNPSNSNSVPPTSAHRPTTAVPGAAR